MWLVALDGTDVLKVRQWEVPLVFLKPIVL